MSERFFEIDPFDPEVGGELAKIDIRFFFEFDRAIRRITISHRKSLEVVANILWEHQKKRWVKSDIKGCHLLSEEAIEHLENKKLLETTDILTILLQDKEALWKKFKKERLGNLSFIDCLLVVLLFQIAKLIESYRKNDTKSCVRFSKNTAEIIGYWDNPFFREQYRSYEDYTSISTQLLDAYRKSGRTQEKLINVKEKALERREEQLEAITQQRQKGGIARAENNYAPAKDFVLEEYKKGMPWKSNRKAAQEIGKALKGHPEDKIKKCLSTDEPARTVEKWIHQFEKEGKIPARVK